MAVLGTDNGKAGGSVVLLVLPAHHGDSEHWGSTTLCIHAAQCGLWGLPSKHGCLANWKSPGALLRALNFGGCAQPQREE